MSTIALCIPAYNAAWCLPRLLVSAKKQSIPFDEILVYNDCSTDNTVEVAEKYGAKVINGTTNQGCSFGKNTLAEIAVSEWIHFHDADDELLPNFTSLAHKWMSKDNAPDVVVFDYEYRDNDTNELLSKSSFDSLELEKDPIKYTILHQINPFCGLYKLDKLRKVGCYDIDEKILYNEDVAFHCKLAIAGFSFAAENEVSIINYRIKNSMSNANQIKCAQAHFEVMNINAKKVGNSYGNEIAEKLWSNSVVLAVLSDWYTAKKAINLAVKLDPNTPRKENLIIKLLSFFNPYFAIKFREKMIRLLKPKLRSNG